METNKKAIGKEIFITILCIVFGIVAFCLMLGILFGGCFPIFKDLEIFESGYFKYVIIGPYKEPFVAIVGFTETGLTQETLEIPREIDGKPVRRIGHRDDVMHSWYYVYSEHLKKIYIHDNIDFITNFEKAGQGEFENGIKVDTKGIGYKHQVNVMICSINDELSFDNVAFIQKVYYYKEIIYEKYNNRNFSSANIVFMYNYSAEINGGYYRLDNIEINEAIPAPPAPKREGYVFTGWYSESECINIWDFNVSPALKEGEEFRLYAGWRVA